MLFLHSFKGVLRRNDRQKTISLPKIKPLGYKPVTHGIFKFFVCWPAHISVRSISADRLIRRFFKVSAQGF